MTLVEHLKSDSDVIKLIVLLVGAVGFCVYLVYLVTTRLGFWRKKTQAKRRQLQRPFIATSNKISPTPKDGSPTFRLSPLNHWLQGSNKWSPSSSPTKTFTSTTIKPVKPNRQLNYSISLAEKQPNPRFLSQVISSINKTDSKTPSGRHSPVKGSRLTRYSPREYTAPFVLDASTTDDSTLPSLILSSEESTENITDKVNDSDTTLTHKNTMDKGVNTGIEDEKLDNNNIISSDKQAKIEIRKPKHPIRMKKDNFTMHLWSHKCQLPCVYEVKPPTSPTWSNSSYSDTHYENELDQDPAGHGKQSNTSKRTSNNNNSRNYSEKKQNSSWKCASNVFVQTEYSGEIKVSGNTDQSDFKLSPLCSSDSTIKDTEQTIQCCCHSSSNHKNRKHSKNPKKLKRSALVRSLDRKLPEEIEILDNEASIKDKTSFIPPKSWYSLGSLCDEEDNCETCGQNWKYDAHRNYHLRMYDSDTKLNSSGDGVSYNDTGYTSTEEDSSRNSADMKGGGSSCDQQSSPENGSYDGDYESDDEIFQVRLVGSEDMVYKPLQSVSEPFGIEAYAAKEWSSDTPTAKAIRQGYAAIPSHVSCHQLRQIRGDNYCAIRATLFQALLNGIPVLNKLPKEGIPQILRTILSSTKNSLQEWSFAGRISVEKPDVISTLEEILAFFIDEVKRCQSIHSKEAKTEHLLSLFNEESGNNEFKLLEAVKLIMLYHAVLLYNDMNKGAEVPVLAWLLFARDTSPDPRGLLRHHLNSVGDTGGLEQVEMCLLGYSLGVVIQVFRPSQVTNPDFIANYPYLEDMPTFSPMVSLVAEDDRHYNIVVE